MKRIPIALVLSCAGAACFFANCVPKHDQPEAKRPEQHQSLRLEPENYRPAAEFPEYVAILV